MITIENIATYGWEAAIRGMRNPKNSWDRSDSLWYEDDAYHDICGNSGPAPKEENGTGFDLGDADRKLMATLASGGPVHAKYRRMIVVSADITAPLYWWKEFDTYKVGTVANSCSTMHKIAAKKFTIDDFSHEHLFDRGDLLDPEMGFDPEKDIALSAVNVDGQRCYFTPEGHLQHTCDILNRYRELFLETKYKRYWWQMIQLLPSSYNQRRTVCDFIKSLPYSDLIIGEQNSSQQQI